MPSSGVIESHVALATRLILSAGHRVRIATHTKHRDVVVGGNKQLAGRRGKDGTRLEGRLEFFDVGGDPARLLPGLLGGESCPAVIILSYSRHPIRQSSACPAVIILSYSHHPIRQSSSCPAVIILSYNHHPILQSPCTSEG
jgi:hypothetical protein